MILLAKRRPKTIQRILSIVLGMIESDRLQSVSPITTMPIAEAEQAFRLMQSRKHIMNEAHIAPYTMYPGSTKLY